MQRQCNEVFVRHGLNSESGVDNWDILLYAFKRKDKGERIKDESELKSGTSPDATGIWRGQAAARVRGEQESSGAGEQLNTAGGGCATFLIR